MKKIAIFGGAFNPIHNGHIHLAMTYQVRVKYDELLLNPSRISPHKDSGALIGGEHRLRMCQLVASHYEGFTASDMELRRDGKSFTIDTVQQLREAYPGDKLYMIVGSDMFLSLDSWHCSNELMKKVTVCAAAREEGEYERLIKKQLELDTMGMKSIICEIDALPVSSTMLRERLQRGLPVSDYLPDYIERYIEENHLYAG